MAVDQKLLLSHLSTKCFKAVEGAFAAAVRARSREVTIEHVFVALLDDSSTELALLVERYQLDAAQLRSALTHAAGAGTLAVGARPALSPALFQWLEEAWMLTSLELGRQRIGSGIVFLKLVQQAEKYGGSVADSLGTIPAEYIKKDLRTIAEIAHETGTETRWTSADIKPLAEAASSVAAGSLPAAYEAAFSSLREWIANLADRGSGLALTIDQDVWVLRAMGGAPPKREASPEPAAPQVESPAAAQSADLTPAASPSPAADEFAPAIVASAPAPPPPPPAPAPAPPPAPAPAPPSAVLPAPAPTPAAAPAIAHDDRPPPSRASARTDTPDAKTLLRRLTKTCVGAMERAAAHAIRDKHHEITPEHFLFELLAEPGTDMAEILSHFALDPEQMRAALESTLSDMRGGIARPNFAPQLLEWIHDSDLAPNTPTGPKIRTGMLFFRFVQQTRKYTKRGPALGLEAIPFEELKKLLPTVLKRSPEASEAAAD